MNRRSLLVAGSATPLLGIGSYVAGVGPFGEGDDGCLQRDEWPDDITEGPTNPELGSIADRHDCATASRPEPTGDVCSSLPGGHSVGVALYPEPPSAFDRESLLSFVVEYEKARIQNSDVAQYRDELIGIGINIEDDETRVLDRDDDVTAVRIQFFVSTSHSSEEYGPSAGHSDGAAVYGVDETGIVRAEAEHDPGPGDEPPDPVEDGTLLECF